jgi:hypothetical protein
MTRAYLTDARLRALAARLSDRDYAVLREVASLRFVSGSQIARLCFAESGEPTPDFRAARRALLRLTQLDLLDRLPRRVGGVRRGSAGFVYHLGPAGQRLGIQRGWLPKRRVRQPSFPGQLFVRHTLAIAELHARLVEAARLGRFELLARESEPTCWRSFEGDVLKPDSYVRLGLGEFEDSYFIEVDRGTEGSRAIGRQLERYLSYFQSGQEQAERGVFPKVLWLATEPSRGEGIAELIKHLPGTDRELFAVADFDDGMNVIEGLHTPAYNTSANKPA